VIVFELVNREDHPVYQKLQIANGNRHYSFLRSIVEASLEMGKPFLSQHVLKALNFHAITCLHTNPGEYRPCPVYVKDVAGNIIYTPPEHYRVSALMDDFVNSINRSWDATDDVVLATYVLWRVNSIHPFINGNGRTARAACYFVLCLKAGGWLEGEPILPELIRQNHNEYCDALQIAHVSFAAGAPVNLDPLHAFVSRLLAQQLPPV
jgi:Fic family protein